MAAAFVAAFSLDPILKGQPMPKFFSTSAGKSAMRLIVNATADSVDLFLHGVVGDQDNSCDAKSLAVILAKHPDKPVTLRINSPGGSFYDGLALGNALRRHEGETTAIVDGLCASAATVVAAGCDKIQMHQNSSWHIHQAIVGSIGHQADLQDALDWLKACDTHLAEVYVNLTGRSLLEIRKVMLGPNGDGTHFSASEAKAFGFVASILPAGKTARYRHSAKASPGASALQKRLDAARAKHCAFELSACGR
jgi:ATP-dependent protease ClpP protease subunit